MSNKYWQMEFDPFVEGAPPFVPLEPHTLRIERLLRAIQGHERLIEVTGTSGLGKTTLVNQALEQSRDPLRRVVRTGAVLDGATLFGGLAEALGFPVIDPCDRALGFRRLGQALKVCRQLGQSVVIVVDPSDVFEGLDLTNDLARLSCVDPHPESRVTVVRVGQELPIDEPRKVLWSLKIRLEALTRAEAETYLTWRLFAAGRREPVFTAKAVTALHSHSSGVIRGLNLLASHALRAGAACCSGGIGPELIEEVAADYLETNGRIDRASLAPQRFSA